MLYFTIGWRYGSQHLEILIILQVFDHDRAVQRTDIDYFEEEKIGSRINPIITLKTSIEGLSIGYQSDLVRLERCDDNESILI